MPEAFKKVRNAIQWFFALFMVEGVSCNPDFRNCGNW